MSIVILCLLMSTPTFSEETRSPEEHVDPWDVVVDYDFSSSKVAKESDLHIIDKELRLAQMDMKYFQEEKPKWEKYWKSQDGEYYNPAFNFKAWNKTYIPPPEGFGDKQTSDFMKEMVPEFDITKIKLKTDKKNNDTVIFQVLLAAGPENKIIGYSSKRLHIQIHAPQYKGAADNELCRYLSKILAVSRKILKIKQGAGYNVRKVYIPKAAIQEKVFIRKLIKEFDLVKVTESYFDA